VSLTGGQTVVHKVAADRFKTTRKKKDSKRKKERAEAKDVPERRKERTEAKDVARKGGGRVVEQGKVGGVAEVNGRRQGALCIYPLKELQ
jgi:hypothetical protein